MAIVKNRTTAPKAFLQQLMQLTIQIYPPPQPSKLKVVRTTLCRSPLSPNSSPSPSPPIPNHNNHRLSYPTFKSNNNSSRCSHPLKPSKPRRHRNGTTWKSGPHSRTSWSRPSRRQLPARRRRSRNSRRRRPALMLRTAMGNTRGPAARSWTHYRISTRARGSRG
jgi:hypothetical protein